VGVAAGLLAAGHDTRQPRTDPYHPDCNAGNFDLPGWLARFPTRLVDPAAGELRRALTRYDPLLFAVLYLSNQLKTDGVISFGDQHLLWARYARMMWTQPSHGLSFRDSRHAFVAPRDSGKSTWWFLLLPMWAAAQGHLRFIAAFAHSGPQAELHLTTFRQQLADNTLLRRDFPSLCVPARKPNGKTTADNITMLRAKSGFTFAARGIDAANLGMKVDERRPELLLLDDVEPDEASYSIYQMNKRRGTITDAILPMNIRAHVVLVGTVTMGGSIVHQLVQAGRGDSGEESGLDLQWVDDERFVVTHTVPIVPDGDGEERSIWPQKWPLPFLREIRHTRSYAKNYDNDPLGADGDYWTKDDFTYGELPGVTYQVLSIDPKIATRKRTDPVGIAVLGYAPARAGAKSRCVVEFAQPYMLVGEALRLKVLELLARFPRVRLVVVEGNQGGENWHAILHDLPCKLQVVWSTDKKETRAADLLEHYQVGRRVIHARRLPALEAQMVAFPKAGNDDLVDAVAIPALRLLAPHKTRHDTTLFPR
jgi:hypothetical protein